MALEPMGDQAVLARCADEAAALHFAAAIRAAGFPWLLDLVGAYTSVAVYFDPQRARYADVETALTPLLSLAPASREVPGSRLHVIPCCYAMQLDLARVVEHSGLAVEEVIRHHAGSVYTVYAIGFCPGYPYLGYLPDALCGVPRLASPRTRVEVGSVGMTGRQTGIYTEPRPGGWNLIGRTPLTLVDVASGYFPLRTGDRVRFEAIGEEEYQRLLGKRLTV